VQRSNPVFKFNFYKGNFTMNLDKVGPGRSIPNDINVIIEIPTQSHPVKYEADKETGAMFVDRFLSTAMYYPCNYGYIPQTLSDDGDPADVLVLAPFPLIVGSVIRCRPIGMLKMTDEAGGDSKLLAVGDHTLATISHFFEHYKDLESGKWVKVDGWVGPEEAHREILESIERYNKK
jgi:inorganic pyrophosphatase